VLLRNRNPNRNRRPVVAAALAVLVSIAAPGCGSDEPESRATDKLSVAASIFPLADVAKQIGGEHVEVATLLPPGATPHGFEPQPRQVEQLADCRLLLAVGLGVDPWAERAAEAGGAGITVLRMGKAAGADAADPHLWLDPALMKTFAAAVADEMAKLDPPNAAHYRERGAAFADEVDKLDAEYREALGEVKGRAFVSFHPAFSHVAKRYGLTQATLAASHASEGGPAALERVVEFVKEHRIKVVFAEPQFPAEKLRWLEEQTGASVSRLDPLGNPAVDGYGSYLDMMRSNLGALVTALSE